MSQVSLGECRDRVVSLVEAGQFEEALPIARHILNHYPEYVEGHLLLGRALLGAGRVRDAADQFARVLGADPENAVALTGLSRVHQALGKREEAIGHMRRAFELCPGDVDLRRQLGELLESNPVSAGQRPEITRAALARIYARNGLHAKAISEFGSVLSQEPGRHDALLGQAELLWRDGRQLEAAETCQQVLDDLPNALKANLILGALWLDSPQPDEARPYLALAQTLDPENAVANSLFGAGSPLPRLAPMLERWEEAASPATCADVAARADTAETDETPLVESDREEAAPMSDHTRPEGDLEIPDWLKGVRYEPSAEESASIEDTSATQAAGETTDWPWTVRHDAGANLTGTDLPDVKVDQSDLPEWLREAPSGKETPDRPEEEAARPTGVAPVEQPPQKESEVAVWLTEDTEPVTLTGADAELTAAAVDAPPMPGEPPDAEAPAWLRELQQTGAGAPEASGQQAGPTEQGVVDAPEWLRSLREDIAMEARRPGFDELDQELAALSMDEESEKLPTGEEPILPVAVPLHEEALAARPEEPLPEPVGGETELPAAPATEGARPEGPVIEEPAAGAPPPGEMPSEMSAEEEPATAVLVAEETATVSAETESAASSVIEEAAQPQPTGAETPPTAGLEESPEPVEELPKDAAERLSIARAAGQAGGWPQALTVYASLVSSSDLLDAVIADLEEGIRSHPDDYAGYQLVGDAYMKNGRLSEALRAYRTALTKLH